MIKEAYVSFETAKLLKEKGFDEKVSTHYLVHPSGFSEFFDKKDEFPEPGDVWLKCPTHQMAMKWLREVHNKHCDVGYDIDLYWFFQIIELKELKENFDYSELKYYHTENETGFNTYEEAVEAAIKYCLENLI